MGTLTDRLIFHAAIDSTGLPSRRAQLKLALRREPTPADWDVCAAIKAANDNRDSAEVRRLVATLTKEE